MARRWKDPLIAREEREERERERRERGGGDRDSGNRPSWREVDRKKDRSTHTDGGGRRERSAFGLVTHRGASGSKNYRAMLDKAFDSGNLGAVLGETLKPLPGEEKVKERAKHARAVSDATGSDAVETALRAYLEAGHAIPKNDFDFLSNAVEVTDEELLLEPLRILADVVRTRKPKRTAALKQRLRYLAERADAGEVRKLAEEAADAL